MKIEILGTGCKSCKQLAAHINQIVSENGIKADIIKVEDPAKILSYGVMSTPALFIDDKLQFAGKHLSIKELKELLL